MARGTVKWFSDQKGYGFITTEGSEESEVFVHFSDIEGHGFKTLHPGETVEFELRSGRASSTEAAHVCKV